MKKLLVGGLLVMGLAILILGPATVYRHASQAIGAARQGVENNIPMDYQLDQLEAMLNEFAPKIDQAKMDLARGQVEVRQLEQEIAALEQRQDAARQSLMVQNERLKGAQQVSYSIAGRQYSRAHLERALEKEFGTFKKREALLGTKRSQLESQRSIVLAAEERVESVHSERLQLEAQVAEMRASLRQIEAMEVASKRYHLDDSVLARARGLADRLSQRLDVTRQYIENEAAVVAPSCVELGQPTESVADQVDAYLGVEERNGGTKATLGMVR